MLRANPPPSKWLVAPGPLRKNSQLAPINGRFCHFSAGCHRDRELAAVLDVHLKVILQVLADAGQVGHRADAEALELARVADSGKLEELR